MGPAMDDLNISGIQADALFASGLQRGDDPSSDQVRQAVARRADTGRPAVGLTAVTGAGRRARHARLARART
jgi:hypothetical protein